MLDKIIEFFKEEPEEPALPYKRHAVAVMMSWLISPIVMFLVQGAVVYLFRYDGISALLHSYVYLSWIFLTMLAVLYSPAIRKYVETHIPQTFLFFVLVSLTVTLFTWTLSPNTLVDIQTLIKSIPNFITVPAIYYLCLLGAQRMANDEPDSRLSYTAHALTFAGAYFLPTIVIAGILMPFTMGFSVMFAMIALQGTIIQFIIMECILIFGKVRNFVEQHILLTLVVFFAVGFTAQELYFPEETLRFWMSGDMNRISGLFKSYLYAGAYATFIGCIYIGSIQFLIRRSQPNY